MLHKQHYLLILVSAFAHVHAAGTCCRVSEYTGSCTAHPVHWYQSCPDGWHIDHSNWRSCGGGGLGEMNCYTDCGEKDYGCGCGLPGKAGGQCVHWGAIEQYALAYCNAHFDLYNSICNGHVCATAEEAKGCLTHFEEVGRAEGRSHDPYREYLGRALLNQGQDCWHRCGGKSGYCDFCGNGMACCRQGWDDPSECQGVQGTVASMHTCGEPEVTPPPSSNVRFPGTDILPEKILGYAYLSAEVYSQHDQGTVLRDPHTLKEYEIVHEIDTGTNYGWLVHDKHYDECVIVHRGSDQAYDFLVYNVDVAMKRMRDTPYWVHSGHQNYGSEFVHAGPVNEWLLGCAAAGRPIGLTGHSLGGSGATWMAFAIESGTNGISPGLKVGNLVTFGSPRVTAGNNWTDGISDRCPRRLQDPNVAIRVVQGQDGNNDQAPMEPPGQWNDSHCAKSIFVEPNLAQRTTKITAETEWFPMAGQGRWYGITGQWALHTMRNGQVADPSKPLPGTRHVSYYYSVLWATDPLETGRANVWKSKFASCCSQSFFTGQCSIHPVHLYQSCGDAGMKTRISEADIDHEGWQKFDCPAGQAQMHCKNYCVNMDFGGGCGNYDFVETDHFKLISEGDTVGDWVGVTSVTHLGGGPDGKYFYFQRANWERMAGYFVDGGKYEVDQYRDGQVIRENVKVIVWDNQNGVHGRYDSGADAGQWQVGDVIRLHEVTRRAENDTPSFSEADLVAARLELAQL